MAFVYDDFQRHNNMRVTHFNYKMKSQTFFFPKKNKIVMV